MLLKAPDLPWTCLMFLKVRRVSLHSPPNTLKSTKTTTFHLADTPKTSKTSSKKKKTTLHQWIDLIERSPKMPLAVALLNGKMVSDAPKDARSFFSLMLLKVVPILGRTLCC